MLTEETNLAKTLAIVQQFAEENMKTENTWIEEKAFMANKIDDLQKQVCQHWRPSKTKLWSGTVKK